MTRLLPASTAALVVLLASAASAAPEAPSTPVIPTGSAPTIAPAIGARDALAAGDVGTARALLPDVRAAATTASARAGAEQLAKAIDGAPVDPRTIGVLLPLSGRYATVGRQLQEALRAGWGASGVSGRLVVVDSGGDAATAVAALDRLVAGEGPIAVVGTVLSDEADAVAAAAEAIGVPFVALAQGLTPSSSRHFVRQGVVTVPQQVAALVAHLFDHTEARRFAIVAPDSDYGRTAAAAFTADVTARGGTIVARETYAADAKDFHELAGRLVHPGGRDHEPTVDYDAIFLPDSARRVPLVAAALAFAEIPVGAFRPHASRSVPLLGLSGWNSYELLAAGGIYTQNGLFTDVFVPPPDTARDWRPLEGWRPFVDAYTAATSRTPTPAEALAWDVARLLAAVRRTEPTHRADFLHALDALHPEPGVTGTGGVDPVTGTIAHRIRIVSVRGDGLVPVDAE